MTLENVFSEEKTQKILEVMPDVVTVWKVALMDYRRGVYKAPYQNTPYKAGLQEADSGGPCNREPYYKLFYHFWVNKTFVMERLNDYLEYLIDSFGCIKSYLLFQQGIIHPIKAEILEFIYAVHLPRVISCVVHKSWITAIGKQYNGLAVVCKRAIFPKFLSIQPDPNTICLLEPAENAVVDENIFVVGHPNPLEKVTDKVLLEI